jgi:hypothetical protein
LGQSLESLFEAPSSPHEEVLSTSSEHEVHLDEAINKIEKPRLDENSTPSQSVEQPGPSKKRSVKWLIKTLEIVHLDDVGKTGTKISSEQYGANEDNSNSGDVDDLNVLYDCELSLSLNLEPTFFKETTSHDDWKKDMHKEYDAHQEWDMEVGGSSIQNQTNQL